MDGGAKMMKEGRIKGLQGGKWDEGVRVEEGRDKGKKNEG